MVIRLTVDPMPAPKPALRYLLLPELKEITPGNPIPNYLKCFFDQDFSIEEEKLGRAALRQADRAARMDKPDWGLLHKVKTDGIGLLLPDLQKTRSLAAGLQDRFREEVALRHFDDALYTAKTMFAMSCHIGEHPTLIGDLVAIAIAYITLGPLEAMLEQPGCPNLYWALTNLPHPLISLDRGLQGERVLIQGELSRLDDRAPMTPEQIKTFIVYLDKIREFVPRKGDMSTRAWLNARTKDESVVRAARRRLVEVGLKEELVARFPADQVMLLDDKRQFEVMRDEEMKLMNLPTWEAEARIIEVEARIAKVQKSAERSVLATFVPSLRKVRRAQGRLEQRIALLRHVEALRMYAAEHKGQLPEKLADIDVPLPLDPFSGKPFRYTREGAVGHLRGSPPVGEEKTPVYNIHYEITIRK
jgi:hypothetical protein